MVIIIDSNLHELSKDAWFHVDSKQVEKSPVSDAKSAGDLFVVVNLKTILQSGFQIFISCTLD